MAKLQAYCLPEKGRRVERRGRRVSVTRAWCVNHKEEGRQSLRESVCSVEMERTKVSHRTNLVTADVPSKSGLETIQRNRVFTRVAEELRALIFTRLKPGDMLPPERELVRRFGVSRSSIRDAIRSLEAIGLLEPRQGVGTVVREPSADTVVSPVASVLLQKQKVINELLDVRMIIEPALARRAALHASHAHIAEMEAILNCQGEKVRLGEIATEEDTAFHYTIALAADNSVMLKLAYVLMDSLREMRERSLQMGDRQARSLAGHRRILAAVKKGDGGAAEAAMRRHLLEIEKVILPMF